MTPQALARLFHRLQLAPHGAGALRGKKSPGLRHPLHDHHTRRAFNPPHRLDEDNRDVPERDKFEPSSWKLVVAGPHPEQVGCPLTWGSISISISGHPPAVATNPARL